MSYRDYQFPHEITVWRKTGESDIYGKTQYTSFSLKCRFERSERLYVNEYGQHERSNGYIYTKTKCLILGDIVSEGDYAYTNEPVDGAYELKNERHISNMRGTKTEHRYIF